MTDDDLLRSFHRHRRLLFTVAYEMLGSVADAEDVVQDAWLRWSSGDRDEVHDPRAFLVRIVSRLALDRLRSAAGRRENYVGSWLPEPLATLGGADPADPAEIAELGDRLSLAMLVVLETLSPLERAVFVLREVFGLPAAEVAEAVGSTDAAVRQVAHRAREHVQARQPRFDTDRRAAREVTERFLAACVGGDVQALMSVLSPGVALVSDGGGKAKAALRPISGADKVARFLVAITAQGLVAGEFEVTVTDVGGMPGCVFAEEGVPFATASFLIRDGRIEQILLVNNPDKLAGVRTRTVGGRA
jgi:RNA polymerase sigma-70 factor (ECF subfamily)